MLIREISKEFKNDKGLSTILTESGRELFYKMIKNEKYKKLYQKNSFRQLKSKKNTVAFMILNYKPVVIKSYFPGFIKNMEIEYKILTKASKGLKNSIPTIHNFDMENNFIILNYINGNNLCDIINNENISLDEKSKIIIFLAEWFKNFHTFFKKSKNYLIRGDSNLRNFIYNNNIIGFDFEEVRIGKPEEDIAELCSSVLTTNPMFVKYKFQLCKTFIKSYIELVDWVITDIWEEISYALLITSVNRGYNLSKTKVDKIVENISDFQY
jgi:tRNA A-37 threonylcarbamoyl transferase component Bud32